MAIKRKTRMYEPWGYQEENNYQGAETILANDLESFFADVEYINGDKKIHFYNKDGEEKATLDVTEFAPSVVESAVYDKTTKILTITFSNGDKVEINLADLIDENEFADGLVVDNGIVKVLIDSVGEPYLSVSTNGIKISGVDQAISDAVEAEKNRAESAETALQAAINAEAQRAQNAETALDNKIGQEIADRKADVDEEEARAKEAEANLSRRLDTLNDELDAEKTIREAADVALGRRIDQEIDDRKADVDEEEARAKAAEQALDERIDEIISGSTPIEKFDELIEKLGYTDNDTLVKNGEHEVAFGQYNISNTSDEPSGRTMFSVGIGTDNNNRSNAIEIRENGDVYMWVEGDFMNVNKLLGQIAHEVYDNDSTHNTHFFDGE